jgi:uncharacterized protein (TIGR00156 family)
MRRLLYFLPFALLLAAHPAGAAEETITSAAGVASGKEDQPVQLRGRIVSRQGRNHFVFADESGNTLVKITRRMRNGQPLLPGMEVEIRGEVDTSIRRPPKVEATSVTVQADAGWTNRAVTPQPQPEPEKP